MAKSIMVERTYAIDVRYVKSALFQVVKTPKLG